MLGTGSIWEDIHPVHQQVVSMLGIPSPSNAESRMSAMRVWASCVKWRHTA
jgi:hypothetical protein